MKKESHIPILVTTSWLETNLQSPGVRIVDCRWVLGEAGEGKRQYQSGHIPGAVHLDVDEQLSAPASQGGPGRHPLPSRRNFQKMISAIGVQRETHVVAYDLGQGMPAPRLWWLLRYFGHEKVSVLDGGWNLWLKEKRPVTAEIPEWGGTTFAARPRLKCVVNKETVDAIRGDTDTLIIDARAPERYRGEMDSIDARAGHIPGALNLPYSKLLDPETGGFLSLDSLGKIFGELGTSQYKTIVCYCGSGVTACTAILALKLAGIEAKLYEGSWSDWSKDPELPAQKS